MSIYHSLAWTPHTSYATRMQLITARALLCYRKPSCITLVPTTFTRGAGQVVGQPGVWA